MKLSELPPMLVTTDGIMYIEPKEDYPKVDPIPFNYTGTSSDNISLSLSLKRQSPFFFMDTSIDKLALSLVILLDPSTVQ